MISYSEYEIFFFFGFLTYFSLIQIVWLNNRAEGLISGLITRHLLGIYLKS